MEPSGRPYNPGVRLGNWFEDIALEEERLKDYLRKRERGELICQRSGKFVDSIKDKIQLSVSRDGKVHFGDTVMIINPGNVDRSRSPCALTIMVPSSAWFSAEDTLCAPTQEVSASSCAVFPVYRSSFLIRSCDGSHNKEVLRYGQPCYICTCDGRLFLHADMVSLIQAAKQSGHCPVSLINQPSHLTEWRILPFHPQSRLELEYSPVDANSRVIVNHVKTNQNLNLEEFMITTAFGREHEVSCWNRIDSHKAELDSNHWMMTMSVLGDDVMPVQMMETERCQPSC